MAPAPEKEKRNESRWLLCERKVIKRYVRDARAALAAAARDGDDAPASAALSLLTAALEMLPRREAALELRARALLALGRYREVADMLRDYIPSCTVDNTTLSSPSSGSGDHANASCSRLLSRFLCFFHVSEIKSHLVAGISNDETHWRYLVLGKACFHLGLLEDALVLLKTHRRIACKSLCWSRDSFSPSSSTGHVLSGSANMRRASEEHSVSQLLAHVKSLLWRRAAAVAAMDSDLPAEAVRQFSKVLDTRHGGVLPHSFAMSCYVGRATTYHAAGRPADAIADCNRALALDPAFIPALRARADLLESIGMIPDSLWDLDYLKLLYDVALRDRNLPRPSWQPLGGVRQGEIASVHRELVARTQQLRSRVATGNGCRADYYALLGVRRGCTRSELVHAHLVLTVRLNPELSGSFTKRLELVDEHRDMEDVRDHARMSARILYRMLQKGYSHVSALLDDEEAAEEKRDREEAATVAALAAAVAEAEVVEQTRAVSVA